MVEIDNNVAVEWIQNPSKAPHLLKDINPSIIVRIVTEERLLFLQVPKKVLEVLSMMQRFEAIFFAILLFVATMEADGKRMTLEKEPEPSNHQLGRKVDVGAKDGIDLTAVDGAGEDDSDVALLASQNKVTTESRHHFFPNESNPYRHNRP
ncbi:hypothetical protein GOBAR_DD06067 [Gossypium barbadense]|nr:hypothetical protein GOBAR_DD06067 [Gossypium barbadense]